MGFSLKQNDQIKLNADGKSYTITFRQGETIKLPLFMTLSGKESQRYDELLANGRSANDIIKDIFKFEIQGGGTTATVSDIGELTGALIGTATLIITSKRAVAPEQINLTVSLDVKTDSFFGPDGVLTPAIDSVEKYISDAMKTIGGYIGTGADWAGKQIFSGSQFVQEQLGIDFSKLSDDDKKKLDDRDLEAENDLFAKLIGLPSSDFIPIVLTGMKIYLAYISAQNLYMEAQIISSIRSIADYDRFPSAKKLRIAKILKTEVKTLENIAKKMRQLRIIPDLIEKLVVGDNPDYGSLLSGLLQHFDAPTLEDLSPDLKCVVNELVVQKLGINVSRREKSVNESIDVEEQVKFKQIGVFDGDMSPENIEYVKNAQLDLLLLSFLNDLKFENLAKIPALDFNGKEIPISMGGGNFSQLFPILDKQLVFYLGVYNLIPRINAYDNNGVFYGKVRDPYSLIRDDITTTGIDESTYPSFAKAYSDIFTYKYNPLQISFIESQSSPRQQNQDGSIRSAGRLNQLNIVTSRNSRLAEAKTSENPTNSGPKGIVYPNGKRFEGWVATADLSFQGERNEKNDLIIALSKRWDYLVERNIIVSDKKNTGWLISQIGADIGDKNGNLSTKTSLVATALAEQIEKMTSNVDMDSLKEQIARNMQKVISIKQINSKCTRQNVIDIVKGNRVEIAQIKPKLDIGLSPLTDLIGSSKGIRVKILEDAFELGIENKYYSVDSKGKVVYVTGAEKLTNDEYDSLLKEIESLVYQEDLLVTQLSERDGSSPEERVVIATLEKELSKIQNDLDKKRKVRDAYKEKINIEERINTNNDKLDGLKNKREDLLQKIEKVKEDIEKLRNAKPEEPFWTTETIQQGIKNNNDELKKLNAELQQIESDILLLQEENKELGYEEPSEPEDSTGETPCLDKYLKMQFMDIFEEIDYDRLPEPVKGLINSVGAYVGISSSDISKTWELISVGKNLYDLGNLGPDAWDEMSPENKAWFAKKFGLDEEWAGDAIKFGADLSLFAQGKSDGNFVGLLDRGFLRFRDTFLDKFAPGANSWRDFERLDPKLQSSIAICLGFKPDDKGSHVVKAQRIVRRAANFEDAIKKAVTIKNSIIAKKEEFDRFGGKGNPEMIENLSNDLELTPDLLSNLYNSTDEIIRDPYADVMDNIPAALGGDPGWRQKMSVPPALSTAPPSYSGKSVTLDVIEQPGVTPPTSLIEKLKKLVEDKAIISSNNQVVINADGSVDWNDNVQITDKALENGKFPVKFNSIKGDFVCSNIKLNTLENAPKTVNGVFDCSGNQLSSLKNSPEEVYSFNCSNNPTLTSLEHIPSVIKGKGFDATVLIAESRETLINCSKCAITSLDSLSTIKTFGKGGIDCSNNRITRFYSQGITPTITSVTNFDCSNNQLETLESSPTIIKDSLGIYGSYNASNNKLKELPDGLFTAMTCEDFNISGNEFVNLSFIPIQVLGTMDVSKNRGTAFNDGDAGVRRFTPTGKETTTSRNCSIKILITDTTTYGENIYPSQNQSSPKSYQYESNGQKYTYIWCSGLGRLDQGEARKDAREGKYAADRNAMFFKPHPSGDPTQRDIYIGDDVCPGS
jgi:hypothetical protein